MTSSPRLKEKGTMKEQLAAKSRALKVEASLEKVRVKAMAMKKSSELPGVALVVLNQVEQLGITDMICSINIVNPKTNKFVSYSALNIKTSAGKVTDQMPELDLNDIRFLRTLINRFKKGDKHFTLALRGESLKEMLAIWKQSNFSGLKNRQVLEKPKVLYLSAARFDVLSSISITSIHPLTEDQMSVLDRMAKTFSMCHTRFLDLQKAEAQARGVQIENALEKVRSRTMAMRKSDELAETSLLLFEQVRALGINLWSCGFHIWRRDEQECMSWMARGGRMLAPIRVPLTENPMFIGMYESRKKGEDLRVMEWSGKMLNKLFRYISALRKKNDPSDNFFKARLSTPNYQVSHFANFLHGNLFFNTLERCPEGHDIFKRFAKVFEQTYTRFLDLQKAEVQAMEAQIEAALERVRAETNAMHETDGLADVIEVVFKQFEVLNIKLDACFINIFKKDDRDWKLWISTGGGLTYRVTIPFVENPVFSRLDQARENGETFFHATFDKKEKNEFFELFFSHLTKVPVEEDRLNYIYESKGIAASFTLSENASICLSNYSCIPYTEEENVILRRIGKVFEQTYTRFLDLQKAEAQAREAQIEMALERVRSRTMAMRKSEELAETAAVLFEQFNELGEAPERMNIGIIKEDERIVEFWSTEQGGKQISKLFRSGIDEPTTINKAYKAWKKGEKSIVIELTGKALKDWIDYLKDIIGLPFNEELMRDRRVHSGAFFSDGMILMSTPDPLPKETLSLMERFAGVFKLTYTRFLDLMKAEAQARESKIEAALEKVRSQSLAMHKADELGEVVTVVLEKLRQLDIPVDDGVAIVSHIEGSKDQIEWMESPGYSSAIKVYQPYFDHPILADYWKAKNSGLDFIAPTYNAEESKSFLNHIFEFTDYKHVPQEVKDYCLAANTYSYSAAFQKNSSIFINNYSGRSLSEQEIDIVKRFAKVFEQAYTRFIDLQKAEAQAREAQIEASLERVRSTSMAMRSTKELAKVVWQVFQEFGSLDIELTRCFIGIFDSETSMAEWWMAHMESAEVTEGLKIPHNNLPIFKAYTRAWREKQQEWTYVLKGKEKIRTGDFLFSETGLKDAPIEIQQGMRAPESVLMTGCYHTFGGIVHSGVVPLSSPNLEILKRFSSVFDYSYARYLDLQKAEIRAREAEIESALERVRGRALAMQSSNELQDVVAKLHEQFEGLDFGLQQILVAIFDTERNVIEWWSKGFGEMELPQRNIIPIIDHPLINTLLSEWKKGTEYLEYRLEGENKSTWDEHLFTKSDLRYFPDEVKRAMNDLNRICLSDAFMKYGSLQAAGPAPLNEEQGKLLQRFAKVLDLAYTRVIDLQNAEVRAREVVRTASLDRVRAEIASMRTTEDLNRITPLVSKELNAMDVPYIRCGVFIVDESIATIHAFLSAPDGRSLGVANLPYNSSDLTINIMESWRRQSIYRTHWTSGEFLENMRSMIEQGQLQEASNYQGAAGPPESLHLHFFNFKQGMLYVGNVEELNAESIESAKSLADSFAIAYARYEDFKQLEEAKHSVDTTLMELKSTQSQLIHSEKMASLGELTAGIAHEIQNPLNFVNNFSEVNTELIDDLEVEIGKGNIDEVKSIARNIRDNEQKINHHGKRADAIVKGMLQHSRSSSSAKELTDINALAHEYLRLTYHGLRAKDKSFDAKFATNLISNAFYAVNQKANQQREHPQPERQAYEPTVIVTTRKVEDMVEICVRDNGNGIPQNVLDKIFQPFFTTKPTGQGTGLGLSLSYDIVKAHGGEIKLETKEKEGTALIIQLPNHPSS